MPYKDALDTIRQNELKAKREQLFKIMPTMIHKLGKGKITNATHLSIIKRQVLRLYFEEQPTQENLKTHVLSDIALSTDDITFNQQIIKRKFREYDMYSINNYGLSLIEYLNMPIHLYELFHTYVSEKYSSEAARREGDARILEKRLMGE